MKLIPWSQMESWSCVRCSTCCRHTTVQLTTQEWLSLTRLYGFGIIGQDVNGLYLRKTINDQCPFLYKSVNGWVCWLQHIKPLACKLWPFRISSTPRYSRSSEACFSYKNQEFYIYAYPQCPGIVLGKPSKLLTYRILPEFLNIRLGLQREQLYSTSKLSFSP